MLPAKLVLNLAGGVGEADAPPISQGKAERGVALRVVATVEKALIPAAMSAVGVVGAVATHDAVLSAAAPIAVALAKADQLKEAVKKAREAAEKIYEAARELWKAAKITLERIIEIVVEAVARAVDYVKAHWFIFAAGLITYTAAQQLDFQLWQEHVAKFAAAIAGVPAFKKAELPLREKAPQVWEAVERFWEHGGREVLAELVDKLNNSGWLKEQAVKAVDVVKRRRRGVAFTWRDVAVAYALAEAAYRHLAPHMPDIEAVVKEVAEKLARGEAVDMTAYLKQFRDFFRKAREVEDRLRARLYEIRQHTRELGLSEVEFESSLAKELVEANTSDLGKLGDATLADKALAFVLGLAADSAYSRAVLGLMERGEGPRAMALTPNYAYQRHWRYKSRYQSAEDANEMPLRKVLAKLLAGLTAFELERLEIKQKEDITRYIAKRSEENDVAENATEELAKSGKGAFIVAAEAKTGGNIKKLEAVVYWEKGGSVIWIYGPLIDELRKWFRAENQLPPTERTVIGRITERLAEAGKVAGAEFMGLLATDWSVNNVAKFVSSATTSLFQAFLDKALGMSVYAERKGTITEVGIKVRYEGYNAGLYQRYLDIAERVRYKLAENPAELNDTQKTVKALINRLLEEGKIVVHPDVGMSAGEAAERIMKAGSEILSAEAARRIHPEKDAPYGRVYYPLIDLLLRDVSETEFAQFFTAAIFGDGSIYPYEVQLILGNFSLETFSYDQFHKVALWLAVLEKYRSFLEKYGIDITPRIYIRKDSVQLVFNARTIGVLFALGGRLFWEIYDVYLDEVGYNFWDHALLKVESMLRIANNMFRNITVHWAIDEINGRLVLRIAFMKQAGGQLVDMASMNVYLNEDAEGNKWLYAKFNGSREKAEMLTSLLRAWGARARARQEGGAWRVELTTDQLAAVENDELKAAINEFVERLKERGLLTEEQAERKTERIVTGLNIVELAGVQFRIEPRWKDDEKDSSAVRIIYQPESRANFYQAIKALDNYGLVKGLHYTAQEPRDNSQGYVRLTIPEGLWIIVLKMKEGDQRAEAFIKQLRSVADRLGVRDYIEERLRPALLAGTKSVAGKTVAYQGVTVTIKDMIVRWEPLPGAEPEDPCDGPKPWCRPRATVELSGGEKLEMAWRIDNTGRVYTTIRVAGMPNRAVALMGVAVWDDDEKEKERIWKQATEKSGYVILSADNLLAMAQYRKELFDWYMAVRSARRELDRNR